MELTQVLFIKIMFRLYIYTTVYCYNSIIKKKNIKNIKLNFSNAVSLMIVNHI